MNGEGQEEGSGKDIGRTSRARSAPRPAVNKTARGAGGLQFCFSSKDREVFYVGISTSLRGDGGSRWTDKKATATMGSAL